MGGSVGPAFKRGFGATTGGDNVKRRGVRTGDRPVEPTAESCTYISREFMILEGEASPERAFSERPCPGDSRRESDNVPSCSTWQCLPPFCVSQRRGWRRSTTSGKRTGGGGRRTWRSAGAPAKDTPNGRRCGRVPPAPAQLAARPAARQPTNNQGPVTRRISIPNITNSRGPAGCHVTFSTVLVLWDGQVVAPPSRGEGGGEAVAGFERDPEKRDVRLQVRN